MRIRNELNDITKQKQRKGLNTYWDLEHEDRFDGNGEYYDSHLQSTYDELGTLINASCMLSEKTSFQGILEPS